MRRSALGWIMLAVGALFALVGAGGTVAMAIQRDPIIVAPSSLLVMGILVLTATTRAPLRVKGGILVVRGLRPDRRIDLNLLADVQAGEKSFGRPPRHQWVVLWIVGRERPVTRVTMAWRRNDFREACALLADRAARNRSERGVAPLTTNARPEPFGLAIMFAAGVLSMAWGVANVLVVASGGGNRRLIGLLLSGPLLAGLAIWLAGKGARIDGTAVRIGHRKSIPLAEVKDAVADAATVRLLLHDGRPAEISMRGLPAGTAQAFVNAIRPRLPSRQRPASTPVNTSPNG